MAAYRPRVTLPTDKRLRKLVKRFRDYLHMPDLMPLYASLACVIGNRLPGDPIWLMLVGPASCGGTEIVWATRDVGGVVPCERLTGEAALLSGVRRKEHTEEATGGLLREIGDEGILLVKDFTAILSLREDRLKDLMGAFRSIYDGHWDRRVGSEGARCLNWDGKMGLLTKCTSAIDRAHGVLTEMGERFVMFRFARSDGESESEKMFARDDPTNMRRQLAGAVKSYVESVDWRREANGDERAEWDLSRNTEARKRIIAMAVLAARCRGVVVRDRHHREDVLQPPDPEGPMRINGQLSQLHRAAKVMRVDDEDVWVMLGRVALDCLPLLRRRLILALAERDSEAGIAELVPESGGCSEPTVRRALDDLARLGAVSAKPVEGARGGKLEYALSEWARKKWEVGYPEGARSMLREEI